MRLVFVYYLLDDGGSAQDIRSYARTARGLGHEVLLYGVGSASSAGFSRDVASADALIFVFEWTTRLQHGDHLDWARMFSKIPRRRRVVIDCDGNYNDPLSLGCDYNHRDHEGSRRWREVCDSVSDKVCQPTLHPRLPNVRPFLFHAYDSRWEVPLDFSRRKEYGMVYVGHSKFRWGPLRRVLAAIAPVRGRVGRVGIVGHGWDRPPDWAGSLDAEDVYFADRTYLQKLNVEIMEPVPYEQVIRCMSKSIFSPVLYRPLFRHLRFVTCRTFETPAAATIPLLDLDKDYVAEIYGERATELVLDRNGSAKIDDILRRPDYYARIVRDVRRHLRKNHAYQLRLKELIDIAMS
jgi:hypothetical protein